MQVEHKLPELGDGALKILAGLFVAFDLALELLDLHIALLCEIVSMVGAIPNDDTNQGPR